MVPIIQKSMPRPRHISNSWLCVTWLKLGNSRTEGLSLIQLTRISHAAAPGGVIFRAILVRFSMARGFPLRGMRPEVRTDFRGGSPVSRKVCRRSSRGGACQAGEPRARESLAAARPRVGRWTSGGESGLHPPGADPGRARRASTVSAGLCRRSRWPARCGQARCGAGRRQRT